MTGFLIRRPDQWASRLTDLYRDDDVRAQMGAAARKLAGVWTIQRHAHRWIDA